MKSRTHRKSIAQSKDKYHWYELSVQSPVEHLDMYEGFFKQHRGKEMPARLREDFCGTFSICCEWVRRRHGNTALGLDLDSEPIAYGMKHHLSRLKPEQRKRVKILRRNVLSVTRPAVDVIIANNFSFCIFKKREELLAYFRACRASLAEGGGLFLEIAGGAGMVEKLRERRVIRDERGRKFTYIWHQQSFDPISHDARYAIHFRFPDGSGIDDAFVYDWRLWSIPELRDCLAEAGFPNSAVFWETEHRGKGTGEYVRREKGTNDYAWVAYVLALK